MTTNTMLNTNNGTIQFGGGSLFTRAYGAGTEASNAVTINAQNCAITTSSLTTGAGSTYTITLTNSYITTASVVLNIITGGTITLSRMKTALISTTAGSGSSTITIYNNSGSAFNGTMTFMVIVL